MAANASDFVTSLHHSCILYDPQYLAVHVHLYLHVPFAWYSVVVASRWWPLPSFQLPTPKQLYDVPFRQASSCFERGGVKLLTVAKEF